LPGAGGRAMLKDMARTRKIVGRFCRKAKAPKRDFAPGSFRWKNIRGNWLLIGCPKGKWQPRKQRCTVGTRLHEILVKAPARGRCCKKSKSKPASKPGVCIKKG
jgi:hypothetical protein